MPMKIIVANIIYDVTPVKVKPRSKEEVKRRRILAMQNSGGRMGRTLRKNKCR